MIVTPRIALRIALIVIVAVVLQVSFFSYLSIFGTTPNVVPVVVVALGLLGGGVVGAVCGFAAGLLLDSLLLADARRLLAVLLVVGYLAGRYREGFEIRSSLVPPLLAGALTMLAAAGFAAIQLMLGVDAPVSLLVAPRDPRPGLLGGPARRSRSIPLVRRVLRPGAGRRQPSSACSARAPRRRAARRSRSVEHGAPRRRSRRAGPRRGVLMFRETWRRPPMPAQFALRVAILGGIAWSCSRSSSSASGTSQVLSGDQYLAQAQNNQVREITVQAPRGEILDRNGKVLVDNRTALALQVNADRAAERDTQRRAAHVRRALGEVAGHARPTQIRKQDPRSRRRTCPANPVTLKPRRRPTTLVYYLHENQDAVPGGHGRARLRAPLPAGHASPRTSSATSARSTDDAARRARATRASQPGDQVGQAGSSTPTTASCAAATARPGSRSTPRASPTGGQLSRDEPQAGQQPAC